MKQWVGSIGTVLLCVVLAVSVRELRSQLGVIQIRAESARENVARSKTVVLSSIAGVGTLGGVVPALETNAKKQLVCGMRSASIDDDLNYWETVSARLPAASDIRLVAYCDGPGCRQFLAKRTTTRVPFTVIAYGEAGSVQAVAAADAQGECLLVDEQFRLIRRVVWRAPKSDAAEMALEILK